MTADRARLPPLRLIAAAPALMSGTALAAEWSLTPSGQLTMQAQNNPRLADDDRKSFTAGAGAQLGVRVVRATERFNLLIRPTVGWQRYEQETDLDRSDQHLEAELVWKGEHVDWSGVLGAVRDTTVTSERGSTGLTQLNERHEGLDVSFGPSWQWSERLSGGANVGWQAARYPGTTESELQNYDYRLIAANLGYVLSDRAVLTWAATAGRLLPERTQLQSDSASLLVQMRYALSSLWTLNVGAGPSQVRTDDRHEHGVIYTAALTRGFERSSLSLAVNRSVSPSGRGVLTQLETAGLNFGTKVTERLGTSCSLTFSRRKDAIPEIATALSDVRYARADFAVSWRVSEHWHLSAGMGYAGQQFGERRADTETARGYDAQLTLGWTGDPHVY